MKSGKEYNRAWNYQRVNNEWCEDIIDPEEDREEVNYGEEAR
jgi:hypothetical protein